MMLRPEPEMEIRKWTNAPIIVNSQVEERNPMNIFARPTKSHYRNRFPPSIAPNVYRQAADVRPTIDVRPINFSSRFPASQRDANRTIPERRFPTEPIFEKVVKNMLSSFPQLTLKNDTAVEYGDAVFALVKNALSSHSNKTVASQEKSDMDSNKAVRF